MANYKKQNKPNMSESCKWHQGYYIPVNKDKCLSRENIYRSSWEEKFCAWCDRNPSVKRWASEAISIKYLNPVANLEYCRKNNINPKDPKNWKPANYWTDFWVELEGKDGNIQKIFIEIKPYNQCIMPKTVPVTAPLKDQKRFIREANTYLVNQAKWKAAKKYFEDRGCKFQVFTEKTLAQLGIL